MGCHTTFYKPANLTYEQARELAIAELNQRLLSNEKYMSTRFKLCNGEVKNPEEIELKICIYLSKFYKRWIKRIESNNPIWKAAVWKFQKENLFPNNNNFYLRLEDFHDCFRVGWDLGDRQLTSLKETLEFCTEYKDRINFCRSTWLEEVNQFWQLYPEGIIDLG